MGLTDPGLKNLWLTCSASVCAKEHQPLELWKTSSLLHWCLRDGLWPQWTQGIGATGSWLLCPTGLLSVVPSGSVGGYPGFSFCSTIPAEFGGRPNRRDLVLCQASRTDNSDRVLVCGKSGKPTGQGEWGLLGLMGPATWDVGGVLVIGLLDSWRFLTHRRRFQISRPKQIRVAKLLHLLGTLCWKTYLIAIYGN